MSSERLPSIYRQYKQDTTYITSYLTVTSRARGFKIATKVPDAEPKSSVSPEMSQRLKGKARKQAKQAAKTSSQSSNTAKKGPPQQVSVGSLIDMAICIAHLQSPPVEIPRSVIVSLDRAIEFRTAFSKFLQQNESEQEAGDQNRQNQSHAHFVDILVRIRAILGSQAARNSSAEERLPDKLVNRFEELNVYEPSDEFLNAPDAHAPESRPLPTSNDAETLVAYYALLKDLFSLLLEVRTKWQGYRDGKCDLAVAALASDAAVSLARSLEDELPESLRHPNNVNFVVSSFLFGLGQISKDRGQKETKTATVLDPDVVELVMMMPCRALATFRQKLRERSGRKFEGSSQPSPSPVMDVQSSVRLLDTKRVPGFEKLCATFDCAFAHVKTRQHRQHPQEGLAMALRAIHETDQIPFWAVFAAQIYLDTLTILNHHVDRAFQEVRAFMSGLDQGYKLTADMEIPLALFNRPKEVKMLELFQKRSQVFTDKALDQGFCLISAYDGVQFDELRRPYFYHKWNPWCCGLWLHRARIDSLWTGIGIILRHGVAETIAQIVNIMSNETSEKS